VKKSSTVQPLNMQKAVGKYASPANRAGKTREQQPVLHSEKPGQHSAIIDSMPAEVMIKVFAGLPARSLVKLRLVSKSFKALIDGHAEAILRPAVIGNQARIQAEADHLINLRGVAFDKAVRRYYKYYGPSASDLIPKSRAKARFCLRWVLANCPRLDTTEKHRLADKLNDHAESVVRESWYKALLGNYLDDIHLVLGGERPNAEMMETLEAAIRKLDVVRSTAKPIAHHQQSMPDFLAVAGKGKTSTRGDHRRKGHFEDCIGMKVNTKARWLWAREQKLGSHLNYRVRDKAIWEMLFKADGEGRGPMVHYKRAAVLEEIFVW